MRRTVSRAILIAAALAAGLPAVAWAPQTRVRMLDEAVRFMPGSLRLALESHRESLLRGALEPQIHEDAPEHIPEADGGTLEARIDGEAHRLIDLLGRQASFDEIAARFGSLAHYVLDAGFPPGVGTDGAGRRYAHFAAFCEQRRGKFPLVFYGHDEPHLALGDFRGFADAIVERVRGEDQVLARAYAAAGWPPAPEAFDDRSVPFAVASLGYSRSINDVVRVWLAAWQAAGGDMGHTPYRWPQRPQQTD